MPRRDEPRQRVPAGSVAIGGEQTGIYPEALPGGWQMIGRTPLTLFDLRADRLRCWRLATGCASSPSMPRASPRWTRAYAMSMTVLKPGVLSSLQDAGRPGQAALGIGRAGAMDQPAWQLGNALVGNRGGRGRAGDAPCSGPTLRFERSAVIALTGAPIEARVDGQPATVDRLPCACRQRAAPGRHGAGLPQLSGRPRVASRMAAGARQPQR